jgi:hypothetical protein
VTLWFLQNQKGEKWWDIWENQVPQIKRLSLELSITSIISFFVPTNKNWPHRIIAPNQIRTQTLDYISFFNFVLFFLKIVQGVGVAARSPQADLGWPVATSQIWWPHGHLRLGPCTILKKIKQNWKNLYNLVFWCLFDLVQ